MTLHLWMEGYRTELRKLGLEFTDKEIVDDFFYEHDKAAIKYPQVNFDIFPSQVREYVITQIPSIKLYEGVKEALETLKENNITLTLVSSSSRRMLKDSLKCTGLNDFFPVMLGFDDVMEHKPNPKAFLEIIEIAKVDPKTTIIIGDSRTDIMASKSAGLDSCLFLPPENKIFYDFEKFKESGPTYVVESLKDFVKIVLS